MFFAILKSDYISFHWSSSEQQKTKKKKKKKKKNNHPNTQGFISNSTSASVINVNI